MRRLASIVLMLASVSGCAATGATRDVARLTDSTGLASYFASRYEGHATASGARYEEARLTAAHRTLPVGTRVRVTNVENGRSVVVTVIDRGPFKSGRVIDVSKRAASDLGFLRQGTTRVRLEVLGGRQGAGETGADSAER